MANLFSIFFSHTPSPTLTFAFPGSSQGRVGNSCQNSREWETCSHRLSSLTINRKYWKYSKMAKLSQDFEPNVSAANQLNPMDFTGIVPTWTKFEFGPINMDSFILPYCLLLSAACAQCCRTEVLKLVHKALASGLQWTIWSHGAGFPPYFHQLKFIQRQLQLHKTLA